VIAQTSQRTHLKTTQHLPFTIHISRSADTLARSIATRRRAFDRHEHPVKNSEHFQKQLRSESGVLISAESKSSGECLGSLKVESNQVQKFYFEKEVRTPDLEAGTVSLCASRISVADGREGFIVRTALCKALYLYAHAMQANYVYAFVDEVRFRLYTQLGFEAAFSSNPYLELECHDFVPLKLIRSMVNPSVEEMKKVSSRLQTFFLDTYHPDIKIFSSVGSLSDIRRKTDKNHENLDPNRRLLPTPTV
jgi:hypothetical protein